MLLGLLDEVTKIRCDPTRVYLTGLSMGGYGSWNLALTHPEKFAAVVPICGGSELIKALLANGEKGQALRAWGSGPSMAEKTPWCLQTSRSGWSIFSRGSVCRR